MWTTITSSPPASIVSVEEECGTLVTLVHDLASARDSEIQTYMVILDFSKAFDRVPHQLLLCKIHHYCIRGHLHKWISSFLSDHTETEVIEEVSSERAPVVSGGPSRSTPGALAYPSFINDSPDNLSSHIRLFADDCITYRTIRSLGDCTALKQDLQALAEWEHKWGMEIHHQKCSVLTVTRS